MESSYIADRFVLGLFVGAGVSWLIVLVIDYCISYILMWPIDNPLGNLAIKTGVALMLAIFYPILLRTVLSKRRSATLLNTDLDAMIFGRLIGVVSGLIIGCTFDM
jgi:hypothetical protein